MNGFFAVYRRELRSYMATPIAYVFIAVFLFAASALAIQAGGLFDQGRAELGPFFAFLPWIFMIFLPALAMRLWSEEIRSGAIEMTLTMPISIVGAVAGKFAAAWTVGGLALVLTAPMWLTMNYLGEPDNVAIAAGYLAAFLAMGAYLALGSAMSALTGNQVIAFVLAVLLAFLFTLAGTPIVLGFVRDIAGPAAAEATAAFSIYDHFESGRRGLIEARSIVFYASFIALWLTVTGLFISARRGG